MRFRTQIKRLIQRVEVVALQPGDTVLLHVDAKCPPEACRLLKERASVVLGAPVLVVAGVTRTEVLRSVPPGPPAPGVPVLDLMERAVTA